MDLQHFSSMLTVSIEAFSALLGISFAFYIFLRERFGNKIRITRNQIDENIADIENVFKQLNPEFVFTFPYIEHGQIKEKSDKKFPRFMESIARAPTDDEMNEYLKRTGRTIVGSYHSYSRENYEDSFIPLRARASRYDLEGTMPPSDRRKEHPPCPGELFRDRGFRQDRMGWGS